MGRKISTFVVIILVVAGVAAIVWGLVGDELTSIQPNKSVTLSQPPLAAPSPSVSSGVTPSPKAPPPAAEPSVAECVGPFMPEAFDVFTPSGQLNPERVAIARDTISAMGGVDPPLQPAVVLGSLTSLPGSDKGTTMIALHSQINPPLVGNFLSEMTQADVDNGSRVVLYGPGCQAAYQIYTLRTDIEKGHLGIQYVKGPTGDLVILTCNLDLTRQRDTTEYRVLVGKRISLAAGS